MKVIFDSIVVDPFVFYAVIVGILLSMGLVIFLLMRSKAKKEDYITLEPIIIEDKEPAKEANIMDININKTESVTQVSVPVEEPVLEEVLNIEEPVLDNILVKMEEDLKTKKVKEPFDYEIDQEEQAVISYQELIKLKNNEVSPKVEAAINKLNDNEFVNKSESKFKNSEFISPIFGKVDNNTEYPTAKPKVEVANQIEEEFKKTVDVRPLKQEYNKSEDFLNSLKDFRRNLE